MRRMLVALMGAAALSAGAAVEKTLDVWEFPLRLTCPDERGWSILLEKVPCAEKKVFEVKVTLDAAEASVPPAFEVAMDMPQVEMHHVWTSAWKIMDLPPDWAGGWNSSLASGQPLYVILDGASKNKMTFACSEAFRPVNFRAGLHEETCEVRTVWSFFKAGAEAMRHYEVRLRFDRNPVFYGEAIEAAAQWFARDSRLQPCANVPVAAYDPLYSTWYAFHQDVHAADIEAECAKAAAMGMKTIILDDGWQTDDTNRGYAFCGDWEVSKRRFPDMAAHVRKVHELGMRYMVWYGLPFVGQKSVNFERFKGKYLYHKGNIGASVLDPRFPEVRDFVSGIYETAMKEWDLDGFKLDFIDAFKINGTDPAVAEDYAGRDYRAVEDAVDRLLSDITTRLRAIKPDALIEFRQTYIGPAIRKYGNMLRAGDCPGDLMRNRTSVAQLRLASGRTAVHSDMLEWNRGDSAENAARTILSVIFSTVQYSMMLRELPESHLLMMRHWIGFSQTHREALLSGVFRPYHPELGCPLIESEGATEAVVAAYVPGTIVPVRGGKTVFALNGTGAFGLLVESPHPRTAEIFDTFGEKVAELEVGKGVERLEVPVSGYVKFAEAPVPFRLGMAGFTYHKYDVDAMLDEMQALGVRYLCIKDFHLPLKATDDEIAAFHAKCRARGVTGYAVGPIYMSTRKEADAAFAYAKRVGVKLIVGVPFGFKGKDMWNNRTENRELCAYVSTLCAKYDIRFAIHNHGPNMPNLFPTGETSWRMVKELNPRMGLCLDIGHDFRSGRDPAESIRKYASRIFDIHLKNVSAQDETGAAMPFREGAMDLRAVIDAASEAEYGGVMSIEYERDFEPGAHLPGLARSIGYFRALTGE